MTIVDGLVLVMLAVSLALGFLRGIVRLLITWAFIVAGVVVAFFHPGLAAKVAPTPLIQPVAGVGIVLGFAIAGALLARIVAPLIESRIPFLRSIDRLGGMVLSGVLSCFSIFMMLNSLVTVDSVLTPLTSGAPVSATQLAQINELLRAHPELAGVLNPKDVAEAQARLGSQTIPSANVGEVSGVLGTWQQIHQQLARSKVAPVIFGIFDHLPVIGRNRAWPS
jgi:uncharacterized membrane protein required for colicin V production